MPYIAVARACKSEAPVYLRRACKYEVLWEYFWLLFEWPSKLNNAVKRPPDTYQTHYAPVIKDAASYLSGGKEGSFAMTYRCRIILKSLKKRNNVRQKRERYQTHKKKSLLGQILQI